MPSCDVAVLGAGAFGTAMAVAIARSGHHVDLYCHRREQADEIGASRENRRYFPGHKLPTQVRPTDDLATCLGRSTLFLALPARTLDDYAGKIADANPRAIVVNLAKGLHAEHFTFASLFAARLPDAPYVALKGPSFAKPMLLGELSGLTCGTRSERARARVIELLADSSIDLDFSSSPEEIDTLSAVKNVYAVALGLAGSLELSENTIYMLVTKVVREVELLLRTVCGGAGSLLSYAGVGDLLLTGMCDTSRNRTLGLMLGRGLHIDAARSSFLTEGVRSFAILKTRLDLDLPILNVVDRIVRSEAEPLALLTELGSFRQT